MHINFPLQQRSEMLGNPLQFAKGVDFFCCDGEDIHFHMFKGMLMFGEFQDTNDLNSRNMNKNRNIYIYTMYINIYIYIQLHLES